MRKILAPVFILALLALNSCQKDLQFDTPPDAGSGTGTGNGPATGSSSTGCKACEYVPACNGTTYTFKDTTGGIASLVTDTLQFVKDTTIDNVVFQKLYSPANKSNSYYNCTDGASREIGYAINTLAGNTVIKADITVLKANLAVGGTWKDSLINPAGQKVLYINTIKEKGISRIVNGKTYTDVIHVYTENGVDLPPFGYTAVSSTDNYLAKGIGLIESIGQYPGGVGVFMHRTLVSYFIPQ